MMHASFLFLKKKGGGEGNGSFNKNSRHFVSFIKPKLLNYAFFFLQSKGSIKDEIENIV